MRNIAIITARGGSKRIPRKNINFFLGKPIISYAINAAIKSKLFDAVMVSTDDNEIAAVSQSYGAEVPFMRGEKNSDDFATTADVLEEVLITYKSLGKSFDNACCIYPTAAFLTSEKLMNAYQLMIGNNFSSVISVVKFSNPILRSFKIVDKKLSLNFPEYEMKRSQDLPPAYYDSGQFYWFQVEAFMKSKKLFTGNSGAFEINEMECQDIDTPDDWKLAEIKFEHLYGRQG